MHCYRRLIGCMVLFLAFVLTSFTGNAGEVIGRVYYNDGTTQVTDKGKTSLIVKGFKKDSMDPADKKGDHRPFVPTDHVLFVFDETKGKGHSDLHFFLEGGLAPVHTITGLRATSKRSQVIEVVLPIAPPK